MKYDRGEDKYTPYFLFVCIIIMICGFIQITSATPHDSAIDTAEKLSSAINSISLPYERELTMQNLKTLGYDTDGMIRPGNYSIVIKSASYDSDKGIVSVNLNAYCNGTSIKVRNPIRWYIPFAIQGSSNPQRLNTFIIYLMSYLETRPYGSPENDDTLIIYATAEGSGDAYRLTDGTWAQIRGGAGEYSHIGPTRAILQGTAATTENQWSDLYRVGLSFNTSGIGTGTIDSATLDFPGYGKSNTFTTAHNIALTEFAPATDGVLVSGDYNTFSDTRLSDADITYANFDIMDRYGYNVFTLNAAGESAISKTGWTTVILRLKGDVDNSVTWESGATTYYNIHITTAGKVPKLTIEYTPGGGSAPVAAFSANTTTGYPPFDIAFTDSSTNTPTAWEWIFGDGDTVGTQSPVHTYDSWIGNTITKYTVNLTASNAFGSDAENKTDYITAYPLSADFSSNVTTGNAPLHVAFTDSTGNGTPSSWLWSFDVLETSNLQNPEYVFTSPGLYYISLNASNSYSYDIETKVDMINVTNVTPTPTPTPPTPTPTTPIPTLPPSGDIYVYDVSSDYIIWGVSENITEIFIDGVRFHVYGSLIGQHNLTADTPHTACAVNVTCIGVRTLPDGFSVFTYWLVFIILIGLCVISYKVPVTIAPTLIYSLYLLNTYLPSVNAPFEHMILCVVLMIMGIMASIAGFRR